ncbi:hypothetical protein [Occallatibacter riparius]|uniref:Uncharacterized protein n=1 Tax=Occallatibacter riparius TaxID=1002689 RepID=A0A9J7BQT1_9BACT|nr:hypothetical protein [Occallatibacter riparius]UWZ85236.1 hypothetical protein MOP44_04660 [Occallatibacter riparius]
MSTQEPRLQLTYTEHLTSKQIIYALVTKPKRTSHEPLGLTYEDLMVVEESRYWSG